jgi:hypothetical protein
MEKFQPETRQSRAIERNESFGTLLGDLAGQSADLVRDEISLAKQEMSEKLSAYRTVLVFMLGGGVIGFLALLAMCTALIIWLGEKIGADLAAALTGLGLAVIAGIILTVGRVKLKSLSLEPELTIKTLEENTEWLKEMN